MELLFVYNADSGKLNIIKDVVHKLVSPSTYECSLCSLTYHVFVENEQWKAFRKSSDHNLIFLHKDEFEAQYKTSFDYPVILDATSTLKVLLSKNEIDGYKDISVLISSLEKAIF